MLLLHGQRQSADAMRGRSKGVGRWAGRIDAMSRCWFGATEKDGKYKLLLSPGEAPAKYLQLRLRLPRRCTPTFAATTTSFFSRPTKKCGRVEDG